MQGATNLTANQTSAQNSGDIQGAAAVAADMQKQAAIDGLMGTAIANIGKTEADKYSNVAKAWDPKNYARMNAS